MGSGASTVSGNAGSNATLPLEVGNLDAPHVTIDGICAWIDAQPTASASEKMLSTELCVRIRDSGLSAPQLLLAMDRDELFDSIGMSAALYHTVGPSNAALKHAHHLVHTGREVLRRDFHVTLKELPDAIDKVVYVMERFPLVLDTAGGQATRYLKYQRGSVLMVGNPRDMEPESLRRHLVAALRYGTLLMLDFDALNTIELEQFFAPESFPREVLSRHALFSPAVFGRLLRPDAGDPDPSEFLVNDQFKLVVVCQAVSPPPKTALAMCVLRVHLSSKHVHDDTVNADGDDGDVARNSTQSGALAKLLGIAKEAKRNSTELVEAAFENDLETVTKCLNKNYDLESQDGHAHTALSEAACQGNSAIVHFLLERGADPNKCNDERRSPLYRAAYNGHLETIEMLLASGADPRIRTKQAETAFDVAKTAEVQDVLARWDVAKTDRLLDERRRVIDAKWQERITSHVEREQFALMQIHQELLELAHSGDVREIERKLEHLADDALATGERPRASADIRDDKGRTLLAIAAQHDHIELVTWLLTKWRECASAAHAVAVTSASAAQEHVAKKHELLAKILKASVNARDCRGWTPVAIAVFHEAKYCLRLLLEHGADPKLKNQYNKNAYDFAKDDLDAAMNIVKSRAEIRQVLVDWENERRAVIDTPKEAAAAVASTTSTHKGVSAKHSAARGGKSAGKPLKKASTKEPKASASSGTSKMKQE